MPPILIKFLPEISAIVLLAAVYSIGHIKGNASCEIASAKREAGTAAKGEKNHAKIELKNMALSDSKLDLALSRFMRD